MEDGNFRGNVHERGAALLIALLAVVFLTILGLVLFEILRGGMVQAASSEASVQAEALAQRGLDEAAALVRSTVDDANRQTAAYDNKIYRIQTAVDDVISFLRGGSRVNADYGYYDIEITDDTHNYVDFQNNLRSERKIEAYPYARVITIKSTGVVSRQRLKIEKTKATRIYVSTINPVFKYPVSAAGDVSLFGAPYVVGDVLSRTGDLNVFDEAVFIGSPGSRYRMASAGPTVNGFYKANGVKRVDPANPSAEQSVGTKFDGIDPLEDPDMPEDSDILVNESYVDPKIDEMNAVFGRGIATIDSGEIDGYRIGASAPTVIASSIKYKEQWVEFREGTRIENADFAVEDGVLAMNPSAKVTVENGSVYVKYESEFVTAAYFAGELSLDPSKSVVVQGNAVIADGFKFKGNLYVQGSLKIVGSVQVDGAIFVGGRIVEGVAVGGDVEMKEMQAINEQSDKPLILAASGKLIFSDSRPAEQAGGETPSTTIRAFLYSEQDVDLYGIMSKIKINGGIHGSRVTFNVLREGDKSTMTSSPVAIEGGGDGYKLTAAAVQRNLTPQSSNLKVLFDDALYTNPPVGIPVTDALHMFVQSQ